MAAAENDENGDARENLGHFPCDQPQLDDQNNTWLRAVGQSHRILFTALEPNAPSKEMKQYLQNQPGWSATAADYKQILQGDISPQI